MTPQAEGFNLSADGLERFKMCLLHDRTAPRTYMEHALQVLEPVGTWWLGGWFDGLMALQIAQLHTGSGEE